MGVLNEGGAVALKVQGLLPLEHQLLLRLHPDDVVSDRPHANVPGDPALPFLVEVGAAGADLLVGPVHRLLQQIIQIDHDALPRGHTPLWKGDERIEDALRGPIASQDPQGAGELLLPQLLVLPQDVEDLIRPLELVQMVRQVPSGVEGRAILPGEEEAGVPPVYAKPLQVQVIGAVLDRRIGGGLEPLHHPVGAAVQDELGLIDVAVQVHVRPAQALLDAV